MDYYISKSDYKVGATCAKKLWYKKHHYPTKNDENEYMDYLAKGGYVVGKMATMIYGGGIDLSHISDWKEAEAQTRELISSNEDIIIYEATVFSKGKLARIDILEKKGNLLCVIEVKAKSQDSADEKKKMPKPYLEDVLFQVLAMEEAYPDYEVQGYLFLPDTSKPNMIEGLAGWFTISEEERDEHNELDELPARSTPKFYVPKITFKYAGTPEEAQKLAELKANSVFELRDIKQADFMGDWSLVKTAVDNMFHNLYSAVDGDAFSGTYTLNKDCKSCEFDSDKDEKNGKKECWKHFEQADTSAFDLFYGGSVKHEEQFYMNYLIEQGKLSLGDIDIEVLTKGKSESALSDRVVRQLMQIRAAQTGEEQGDWIGLNEEIDSWGPILYFIDFETYAGAIPFHRGMRPYEMIPFQWSCHRLDIRTGTLTHGFYLNDKPDYPGVEFAQRLMNFVGNDGTPLMWSSHENTTLRRVLQQMKEREIEMPALQQWLMEMTHSKEKPARKGRLVDMCKTCERYYLHPDCKGKASIKKILPAIWHNPANTFLHKSPYFTKYYEQDESGAIKSPYKTLKAVTDFIETVNLEEEEVVEEGTGAMKAYYELIFGRGAGSAAKRKEIQQLLLQYCELDTMAMVIIYEYWLKLTKRQVVESIAYKTPSNL